MLTEKISTTHKNVWKNRSKNTNEEEDEECLFCLETFLNSASGDRWVCCMSCSKWTHEECVGIDPLIKDDIVGDIFSVDFTSTVKIVDQFGTYVTFIIITKNLKCITTVKECDMTNM
jgi:hypothetical protein